MIVSSYDRNAPVPKVGSRWVWEIDLPHAREIIEVTEVRWNGEEWFVGAKALLPNPTYPSHGDPVKWNDLGRFYEACLPVLPKLTGRMDQFTERGRAGEGASATEGSQAPDASRPGGSSE